MHLLCIWNKIVLLYYVIKSIGLDYSHKIKKLNLNEKTLEKGKKL